MKEMGIQEKKPALLNERTLLLKPYLAQKWGLTEALIIQQICFLSKACQYQGVHLEAARASYTRLQKHLSFFTRRWLIKKTKKLESEGVIQVTRTKRVNLIGLTDSTRTFMTEQEEISVTKMIVFPSLVQKVGLSAAVLMQQVHLRTYESNENKGVIMSVKRWSEGVCPFFSASTVQRVLAELKKKELIVVTKYHDEFGSTNCFRINYANLEAMMKSDDALN